jgi:hypothetical protein
MALKQTISEQLRGAIESGGKSRYRISLETGIPQATLSRFVNELADLELKTADKICENLGLRLVQEPRPTKRKARKPKG